MTDARVTGEVATLGIVAEGVVKASTGLDVNKVRAHREATPAMHRLLLLQEEVDAVRVIRSCRLAGEENCEKAESVF